MHETAFSGRHGNIFGRLTEHRKNMFQWASSSIVKWIVKAIRTYNIKSVPYDINTWITHFVVIYAAKIAKCLLTINNSKRLRMYRLLSPQPRFLQGQSDCPFSWFPSRASGLLLSRVSGAVGIIRCVRRMAKYSIRGTICHICLNRICLIKELF